MWHVALESWHWIRPVAAPCNVTRNPGITTLNSPGGSTLQCGRWLGDNMPLNSPKRPPLELFYFWFRFWHAPQSTCHSAPVCEILSKSDHPRYQIKMTSCRFSRRQISAILDFRGPIIGSLKSACTTFYRSSIDTINSKLLSFWENRVFVFWRQTDEQMDRPVAWSRSRCRELRLNN